MEALEIVEKVDAFYKTSWEHLLLFGGIAAFVLGVVLPLLHTFYQRRLFKVERTAVDQLIKERIEEVKSSLFEEYQRDLQSARAEITASLAAATTKVDEAVSALRKEQWKEFAKLRTELNQEARRLRGSINHVQGNDQLDRKAFIAAIDSFADAAVHFAECKDELNLGRVLAILEDDCLPHVEKKLYDEFELAGAIARVATAVEALDQNGRYHDTLRDLREAAKAASVREPPAAAIAAPQLVPSASS
jgi:F0F1-type ATP synthase membrane subunit b/b'